MVLDNLMIVCFGEALSQLSQALNWIYEYIPAYPSGYHLSLQKYRQQMKWGYIWKPKEITSLIKQNDRGPRQESCKTLRVTLFSFPVK